MIQVCCAACVTWNEAAQRFDGFTASAQDEARAFEALAEHCAYAGHDWQPESPGVCIAALPGGPIVVGPAIYFQPAAETT